MNECATPAVYYTNELFEYTSPIPTMPLINERLCIDCSTPLGNVHGNTKYCPNCKIEARKEKDRRASRKYYKQNKKHVMLRKPGTTTLNVHPNPDFEREAEIISNEKKRIIGMRTSTKKRKQKGLPKNSVINYTDNNSNSSIIEYGDPQPLGTLLTHNFAKFNDYTNTSTDLIMKHAFKGRECPECDNSSDFHKDRIRAEITCTSCGLVLVGTESNIEYPWKITYTHINCPKCDSHITYDLKSHLERCSNCGYLI